MQAQRRRCAVVCELESNVEIKTGSTAEPGRAGSGTPETYLESAISRHPLRRRLGALMTPLRPWQTGGRLTPTPFSVAACALCLFACIFYTNLARIIHRVPKRRVAKSVLARLYARGPRRHSRALCRGARVGVTQPARGLAALQPAVYELCGLAARQGPHNEERFLAK